MGRVSYATLDGEIVSETREGVERDYLPDSLGSTIALMDDTQTLTDTWTYWPYGEVASRAGTNPTPMQWVGPLGITRIHRTATTSARESKPPTWQGGRLSIHFGQTSMRMAT